jgi:dephospho-CoA kinase
VSLRLQHEISWNFRLEMLSIGLTGGIGSGKSNVLKILKDCGAKVIDADTVGHSVYEPNTDSFSKIVSTFGKEVVGIDGKIDRKVLGSKVFRNEMQMRKLTDIVWPAIGNKIKEVEIKDSLTL